MPNSWRILMDVTCEALKGERAHTQKKLKCIYPTFRFYFYMPQNIRRTRSYGLTSKFLEDDSLTASEASPQEPLVAPVFEERHDTSSPIPSSCKLSEVLLSDFFNLATRILFASAKEDNCTKHKPTKLLVC